MVRGDNVEGMRASVVTLYANNIGTHKVQAPNQAHVASIDGRNRFWPEGDDMKMFFKCFCFIINGKIL